MDDGAIEVIVIETSDAVQVLRPLLVGLVDKTGKSLGRPHVECFRGQKVTVRTTKVIPLEVDGESCSPGVNGYDARVIPGAVNVIVDSMWYLDTVEYDYPDFHLSMDCFVCTLAEGSVPHALEHAALRWLSPKDLLDVRWLPADDGLVRSIGTMWDQLFQAEHL